MVVNFYSLAPLTYKPTVVQVSFIEYFDPPATEFSWKSRESKQSVSSFFYEPLITKALEKCYNKDKEDNHIEENEEEKPKHIVRLQYIGKISDDYRRAFMLSRCSMSSSFHSSKIENYTTITESSGR